VLGAVGDWPKAAAAAPHGAAKRRGGVGDTSPTLLEYHLERNYP